MVDREFIIFIAYAREDENIVNEIVKILNSLKNRGFRICWYDIRISPGKEVKSENAKHLNSADIILLLISKNFLASKYGYGEQVKKAIQRHQLNLARVIPVILRPSDIADTPFENLAPLPKDGKPVIMWRPPDAAYKDISEGIRKAIEDLSNNPLQPPGNITPFRKPSAG